MIIKVMREIPIHDENMTLIDRYFLISFHPRKIILSSIAATWATYFLWNRNWLAALLSVLILETLGLFFTRHIDPDLMAGTTLGRIGLLHKHPINFALNFIGSIILIYALWDHAEIATILFGLSIVILGHFFGWGEVSSKLRDT